MQTSKAALDAMSRDHEKVLAANMERYVRRPSSLPRPSAAWGRDG